VSTDVRSGLFIGLTLLLLTHDPNVPFADWMKSLIRPDVGGSCCGPSDQVYVDRHSEDVDGGFTAFVDNRPISIPANKVIWDRVNPTGRGVLFYREYGYGPYVFCLYRGPGYEHGAAPPRR